MNTSNVRKADTTAPVMYSKAAMNDVRLWQRSSLNQHAANTSSGGGGPGVDGSVGGVSSPPRRAPLPVSPRAPPAMKADPTPRGGNGTAPKPAISIASPPSTRFPQLSSQGGGGSQITIESKSGKKAQSARLLPRTGQHTKYDTHSQQTSPRGKLTRNMTSSMPRQDTTSNHHPTIAHEAGESKGHSTDALPALSATTTAHAYVRHRLELLRQNPSLRETFMSGVSAYPGANRLMPWAPGAVVAALDVDLAPDPPTPDPVLKEKKETVSKKNTASESALPSSPLPRAGRSPKSVHVPSATQAHSPHDSSTDDNTDPNTKRVQRDRAVRAERRRRRRSLEAKAHLARIGIHRRYVQYYTAVLPPPVTQSVPTTADAGDQQEPFLSAFDGDGGDGTGTMPLENGDHGEHQEMFFLTEAPLGDAEFVKAAAATAETKDSRDHNARRGERGAPRTVVINRSVEVGPASQHATGPIAAKAHPGQVEDARIEAARLRFRRRADGYQRARARSVVDTERRSVRAAARRQQLLHMGAITKKWLVIFQLFRSVMGTYRPSSDTHQPHPLSLQTFPLSNGAGGPLHAPKRHSVSSSTFSEDARSTRTSRPSAKPTAPPSPTNHRGAADTGPLCTFMPLSVSEPSEAICAAVLLNIRQSAPIVWSRYLEESRRLRSKRARHGRRKLTGGQVGDGGLSSSDDDGGGAVATLTQSSFGRPRTGGGMGAEASVGRPAGRQPFATFSASGAAGGFFCLLQKGREAKYRSIMVYLCAHFWLIKARRRRIRFCYLRVNMVLRRNLPRYLAAFRERRRKRQLPLVTRFLKQYAAAARFVKVISEFFKHVRFAQGVIRRRRLSRALKLEAARLRWDMVVSRLTATYRLPPTKLLNNGSNLGRGPSAEGPSAIDMVASGVFSMSGAFPPSAPTAGAGDGAASATPDEAVYSCCIPIPDQLRDLVLRRYVQADAMHYLEQKKMAMNRYFDDLMRAEQQENRKSDPLQASFAPLILVECACWCVQHMPSLLSSWERNNGALHRVLDAIADYDERKRKKERLEQQEPSAASKKGVVAPASSPSEVAPTGQAPGGVPAYGDFASADDLMGQIDIGPGEQDLLRKWLANLYLEADAEKTKREAKRRVLLQTARQAAASTSQRATSKGKSISTRSSAGRGGGGGTGGGSLRRVFADSSRDALVSQRSRVLQLQLAAADELLASSTDDPLPDAHGDFSPTRSDSGLNLKHASPSTSPVTVRSSPRVTATVPRGKNAPRGKDGAARQGPPVLPLLDPRHPVSRVFRSVPRPAIPPRLLIAEAAMIEALYRETALAFWLAKQQYMTYLLSHARRFFASSSSSNLPISDARHASVSGLAMLPQHLYQAANESSIRAASDTFGSRPESSSSAVTRQVDKEENLRNLRAQIEASLVGGTEDTDLAEMYATATVMLQQEPSPPQTASGAGSGPRSRVGVKAHWQNVRTRRAKSIAKRIQRQRLVQLMSDMANTSTAAASEMEPLQNTASDDDDADEQGASHGGGRQSTPISKRAAARRAFLGLQLATYGPHVVTSFWHTMLGEVTLQMREALPVPFKERIEAAMTTMLVVQTVPDRGGIDDSGTQVDENGTPSGVSVPTRLPSALTVHLVFPLTPIVSAINDAKELQRHLADGDEEALLTSTREAVINAILLTRRAWLHLLWAGTPHDLSLPMTTFTVAAKTTTAGNLLTGSQGQSGLLMPAPPSHGSPHGARGGPRRPPSPFVSPGQRHAGHAHGPSSTFPGASSSSKGNATVTAGMTVTVASPSLQRMGAASARLQYAYVRRAELIREWLVGGRGSFAVSGSGTAQQYPVDGHHRHPRDGAGPPTTAGTAAAAAFAVPPQADQAERRRFRALAKWTTTVVPLSAETLCDVRSSQSASVADLHLSDTFRAREVHTCAMAEILADSPAGVLPHIQDAKKMESTSGRVRISDAFSSSRARRASSFAPSSIIHPPFFFDVAFVDHVIEEFARQRYGL